MTKYEVGSDVSIDGGIGLLCGAINSDDKQAQVPYPLGDAQKRSRAARMLNRMEEEEGYDPTPFGDLEPPDWLESSTEAELKAIVAQYDNDASSVDRQTFSLVVSELIARATGGLPVSSRAVTN